jgi:glycosyltransferase involved in cell wall biosynthesis
MRDHWLNPLLLLDPPLYDQALKRYPGAPVHLLADPYPEDFHADRAAARKAFDLPADKLVFLFYGGGYKRKGLQLVAEAMLKLPAPGNFILLCAGLRPGGETLARQLETLRAQGRARLVNRYVSAGEEKQLFAAGDVVLLPYTHHQGTSSVLARAAGAGKPVIASDEHFIGRVVRQHGMGLLFPTGNVTELKNALLRAAAAGPEELARWSAGARACAQTCSRSAFRTVLVGAVERALATAG